jgi:hypothetical protein
MFFHLLPRWNGSRRDNRPGIVLRLGCTGPEKTDTGEKDNMRSRQSQDRRTFVEIRRDVR